MASVGSTAVIRVFGVSYRDVQSGTRANWSAQDNQAFEAFARNHGATSKNAKLAPKTDITSLLDALQLSWFFNGRVLNSEGNDLAPILEVKVRRKLQAICAEVPPIDTTTLQKTRLQSLRYQAVQAGQTPPEKLATLAEWKDEKYSPEPWNPRKVQKARQEPFSTVDRARKEVARLTEALQSARHKLEELERAEEAKKNEAEDRDGDSQQDENEEEEEDEVRRQEPAYFQVSAKFPASRGTAAGERATLTPVLHHQKKATRVSGDVGSVSSTQVSRDRTLDGPVLQVGAVPPPEVPPPEVRQRVRLHNHNRTLQRIAVAQMSKPRSTLL